MKYFRIILAAIGLLYGASDFAFAATNKQVYFNVTDVPGHWYDACSDKENKSCGGGSLAIVTVDPGASEGADINFHQVVESRHTVTSLVWPTAAKPEELIDQNKANTEDQHVTLKTPGLYVFVCKLHPYMLGAVIVDDKNTTYTYTKPGETKPSMVEAYDLGAELTLLGANSSDPAKIQNLENIPTTSNLAARLLRAFFIVTNPEQNWKDYTKVGTKYQPIYPDVPVYVQGVGAVPSLKTYLESFNFDGKDILAPVRPHIKGIGEVWVDTQFELSDGKGPAYPGTITVLNANSWKVKRKVALPSVRMNNGHNMWPSHNQKQIYQTEWHGTSLFVIERVTGKLLNEIKDIGADPAHVMTRVDTQQVHVGLNGEDCVVELNKVPAPEYLKVHQCIKTSILDPSDSAWKPTQPHAHWMGFDGHDMVTPNANTNDSTLYAFDFNDPDNLKGNIISQNTTGALSIATGMMPDSSKYYVSNYLGHTISVMNGPVARSWYGKNYAAGAKIKDISLLEGYKLADGCGENNSNGCKNGLIGGLPVQTPVSPDGKFVIIGNTLGGTIAIIRTSDDTLQALIPCDPGCHGVQFGAKRGGGYVAYVTSKFANRLIVVDYDKNNDGELDLFKDPTELIAGSILLAKDNVPKDDTISGNRGMGGQGVMPIPNVYNGWVQELPIGYKAQLTRAQRNPIGPLHGHNPHDDHDHDGDHK